MLERGIKFLRKYLLEEILLLTVAIFLLVQQLSLILSMSIVMFYILVVFLLNDTFISRGLRRFLKDIRKEYLYTALIVIFIALLSIWNFHFESVIFLTIFVAFAFYGWDSRIVATGALVSLASCPFLLIAKQDVLAEQMAVYAYYFLVITVILQIIEYKRHPELFKDDENEEK